MLHPSRLPLLVTGIAGVAGYNAFHYLRKLYPGKVFGVRREDNWRLRGDQILSCNIHDLDGLKRLFEEHQFRSVLHCEGTCALRSCELDPPMAYRVNVEGTQNLVSVMRQLDRLVFGVVAEVCRYLNADLLGDGILNANGRNIHDQNAACFSIG
mgnify:CR=1 FL=1